MSAQVTNQLHLCPTKAFFQSFKNTGDNVVMIDGNGKNRKGDFTEFEGSIEAWGPILSIVSPKKLESKNDERAVQLRRSAPPLASLSVAASCRTDQMAQVLDSQARVRLNRRSAYLCVYDMLLFFLNKDKGYHMDP